MNWIDYAIIFVIGASTLISFVRGFTKEALSLVIWVIAFVVAGKFYPYLATYITQIQDTVVRNAVSAVLLFIAVLILGALVNYLIGQLVSKTGLSGTDRVLGLCFGMLRGVLIISAILFFMDQFTGFSSEEWWKNSTLISKFSPIIQWFFDHWQQTSSFIKPKS